MQIKKRGFTIIELLVVIALILILSVLTFVGVQKAKGKSKIARVSNELVSISQAITQFAEDNNYQYPPDTVRSVPPGLEKYLAGGTWPTSVWPDGVFDWDNWDTVNGQPSPRILQMTYRLCDLSDPISSCSDPQYFPHFKRNSAIFYCVSGPCIPHQNEPTAPAYCVNCKPKEVNPPL